MGVLTISRISVHQRSLLNLASQLCYFIEMERISLEFSGHCQGPCRCGRIERSFRSPEGGSVVVY